MKNVLLLTVLTLLSACAFERMPPPVVLDYTNMNRIYLDVKDLRIIDRATKTPRWAPYVGHEFAPTLTDALYRLAGDRLQAVGTKGRAKLVIKDVSVMEQPIQTSTTFDKMFTREQGSKYIGRVEVSLEAFAPRGVVRVATAHAVHSVTLPEDPSEAEKYRAYSKLLNNIVNDLNLQLDKAIRSHMKRFIVKEIPASMQQPVQVNALQ